MAAMQIRPERFIACPECACHAKASENECPHCGAALRKKDGSVPRTAAAMLMGLMALPALGSLVACSDGDGGGTGGGGNTSMSSSSSGGGSGQGGSGVGGVAPAYGVALTDMDGDGYFFPGDDCNDNDANIHPMAAETPGDMKDSNCNGDDNT